MKKSVIVFILFLFTTFNLHVYAGEPPNSDYDVVTNGTRQILAKDGSTFIKILVDESSLGGSEVEIAELTFPPNSYGGSHLHDVIEIFYVLSGQLTHVVNGQGARLLPGMVGIVRPGDKVEHIVEIDEPTKVLVIWTPGGEIESSLGGAPMVSIPKLEINPISHEKLN